MEQVFSYIISLGASVMMPIIFTVIGLCIGMKFGKALKSGLFVGVGFVGLGVVTALLTTNFNDPLKAISDIYHLQLNVFDMGWPAAAAVAYNTAVGCELCDGFNLFRFVICSLSHVRAAFCCFAIPQSWRLPAAAPCVLSQRQTSLACQALRCAGPGRRGSA